MKLRAGDAFKLMRCVKRDSVDLCIVDFPYDLGAIDSNVDNNGRDGWQWSWDKDVGFDLLSKLDRVVRPGGAIVCFHKWQVLGDLASELERTGFDVKDRLTWIKTNPRRLNQGRRFLADVENMVWAVKRPTKGWEFRGPHSSVFWYPKPPSFIGRHPCEKPLDLMKDLVRTLSPEDGVVFDPFMGCGVVGQACVELGRSFVGFEKELKYYHEAERRLCKLPASIE